MQKSISLFLTLITLSFYSEAQFTRYIVRFTDKGSSPFSLATPAQYLSQRAIDRRVRYDIPVDSSDLPVTPRYLDSIRLSGNVTILNVSRWLNQVAIKTSDAAALAKINSFPFVAGTSPVGARIQPGQDVPVNKQLDPIPSGGTPVLTSRPDNINGYYNYGSSNGQVKIHQGDFLHNHGFRGEGMHMAVLDAGFYHYLSLPTFDSMRNNNQVLGTWDFVANNASVDEDNSHGMQCLSTIAANIPGTFVGTSPKTSFYLFRTEDVGSEYPVEEQNLAAGFERADSLGVDLCSVSLGYYDFDNAVFNYSYADMNGNTSISARAADLAARKGMLIVTAAGNEGNNSWHYLITPSDADSVLSVGAVDTTGLVAGFSSYGPSSDGQVKPSVAAVGAFAVVANTATGQPNYGFGTSFACPNMAGVTSCLWQAFPEISNMGIISTLEASANRAGSPNDRIGHGIPDAKKSFVMLQKKLYTQQASILDCKAILHLSVKTDNTMSIVIERKLPAETGYTAITSLLSNSAYGKHDFEYSDDLAAIAAGLVKYRFRMNIATDTSYYLDSVSVDHPGGCIVNNPDNISISPNPVSDIVNIRISRAAAAKVSIVIRNALGQKVHEENYQHLTGTVTTPIPMARHARGAYFITVFIDNRKEVTRKVLRD